MIERICGTCGHWFADNTGEKGACHRFPPAVFPMVQQARPMIVGQSNVPTLGTLTIFPMTEKNCEGCGEWGEIYEKTA